MSSKKQNTGNSGNVNIFWLAGAVIVTIFMGAIHIASTYFVAKNPLGMRLPSTIFNFALGVLLLVDLVMMAQFRRETERLKPIALITAWVAYALVVINVYAHINMNIANYGAFDMFTACAHPILFFILIFLHPKGKLIGDNPYE